MSKKNEKKTKNPEEVKPKLKELVQQYDKKFNSRKYWLIFIASIIGTFGLGLLFKLDWYFIIAIALCAAYCTPRILLALSRNKYEEQKYLDTTNYIEQMLYSFRRNSKILGSLRDTLICFSDGEMHDTIQKAIDYIQTADTEGNVYEEALDIIEEKYECRRIKSLHRYLVKVEGAGGNHDVGIGALITDRRLWMERIDEFKKEKSSVLKEIIVATIFASVVCTITAYMLPQDVGAAKNIVCQVYSTIYIIINMLNIKASLTRTILHLNDIDDETREKEMLKKLNWYRNYDIKVERKKALMITVILGMVLVAGIFIGQWLIVGVCGLLMVYCYFLQPMIKYRNTRKSLVIEFSKVYPDWLLELSLLLQTDNLHVALEKTIDDAPLMLKGELRTLADKIAMYPTDIEPYSDFLNYLPLPNVHSSMKLLYSISEFGTEEEEKQISELIERNSILMDKAEAIKNQQRLAKVYVLKFVPMGTSAFKLIVDMAVFLVIFISQTLTVL